MTETTGDETGDAQNTITADEVDVDDVEDLLVLKSEYVPVELRQIHDDYHAVTNPAARIGMGSVDEGVAELDAWDGLGARLDEAAAELLEYVAEEHAEAVAEGLAEYRGDGA